MTFVLCGLDLICFPKKTFLLKASSPVTFTFRALVNDWIVRTLKSMGQSFMTSLFYKHLGCNWNS